MKLGFLTSKGRCMVLCTENPIYVFLEMELRGLIPTLFIYERFIYSQDRSAYLDEAK
jgi:hypothetical protein